MAWKIETAQSLSNMRWRQNDELHERNVDAIFSGSQTSRAHKRRSMKMVTFDKVVEMALQESSPVMYKLYLNGIQSNPNLLVFA